MSPGRDGQGTTTPVIARAPAPSEGPAFSRYVDLTMPPGALGPLMEPVLRILASAATRGAVALGKLPVTLGIPDVRAAALLFAGDHGVARQKGVSAFPCEVTAQMVANFVSGGAAMSVLSRRRGMTLDVCDVGVATPLPPSPQRFAQARNVTLHDWNIPREKRGHVDYLFGSRDISEEDALHPDDHQGVFERARVLARTRVEKDGVNVMVLGEMGIGNTTPATALAALLLREDAAAITGVGTGINLIARRHKSDVVRRAVDRFRATHSTATQAFAQGTMEVADAHALLASLGGFELSAMAGAACGAAESGCHVVLDGVICTAAVVPFALVFPELKGWLIAGHRSAEPAHGKLLGLLSLSPLVDLNLRLGEGSGAAVACGLLQDAVALLQEMSTFADAGVSTG